EADGGDDGEITRSRYATFCEDRNERNQHQGGENSLFQSPRKFGPCGRSLHERRKNRMAPSNDRRSDGESGIHRRTNRCPLNNTDADRSVTKTKTRKTFSSK
ncbi:Hypothetical predicted protein, partial [Paramuricea clavata]